MPKLGRSSEVAAPEAASSTRAAPGAHPLLNLQATAGNTAVSRLVAAPSEETELPDTGLDGETLGGGGGPAGAAAPTPPAEPTDPGGDADDVDPAGDASPPPPPPPEAPPAPPPPPSVPEPAALAREQAIEADAALAAGPAQAMAAASQQAAPPFDAEDPAHEAEAPVPAEPGDQQVEPEPAEVPNPNTLVLPPMPPETAEELVVLVEADLQGQAELADAIARSQQTVDAGVAEQSTAIDASATAAEAALKTHVRQARRRIGAAKAGAAAKMAAAQVATSGQLRSDLDTRRTTVRDGVTKAADDAQKAIEKKAGEARDVSTGAAAEIEGERDALGTAATKKAGLRGLQARTGSDDRTVAQASLDAQRSAATKVGQDTVKKLAEATKKSIADLRLGGTQTYDGLLGQLAPTVQRMRDQSGPMAELITRMETTANTALTTQVSQGTTGSLETAATALLQSLSGVERSGIRSIRQAATTAKQGLAQTAASGNQQLAAKPAETRAGVHDLIGQHLSAVSSRPMRRRLARLLAAELTSLLREGYSMSAQQAGDVGSQIASQLTAALASFHTSLQQAADQSGAAADRTATSGATQLSGVQRMVLELLARTAADTVTRADTTATQGVDRLRESIDGIASSLDPVISDTRRQVTADKTRMLDEARAAVTGLDGRIDQAMRKARETTEVGAWYSWLADQVRSIGEALSNPSFWVGLLVGLLVTIFIIATFGSGFAVLVIAGAVAGGLAAGASYLAQVYLDPLVHPNGQHQQFSWGELGSQMAIGVLFGAIGGAVGGGVASGMGNRLAQAFVGRAAQTVVGTAFGVVQNCVTGPGVSLLDPTTWTLARWDEGLLLNLTVNSIMGSKRVGDRVEGMTNRARDVMVDRGHARNVTAQEQVAAGDRRAERVAAAADAAADAARARTGTATADRPVVPTVEPPPVPTVDLPPVTDTATTPAAVGASGDGPARPAVDTATTSEPASTSGRDVPTDAVDPTERVPTDTTDPAERVPTDTADPAERVPTDTTDPTERAPTDTADPAERVPTDTTDPAERVPTDTTDPTERVPTDTTDPTERVPTDTAGPTERVPAQDRANATEPTPVNDGPTPQPAAPAVTAERPPPSQESFLLRPGDPPATPAEIAMQVETGTPVRNQREMTAVANENGVQLDVRPTTSNAPELLAQGNRPKPEAIKAKSINAIDAEFLGFRSEDRGLVGYRDPIDPSSPTAPAAVRERFEQATPARRREIMERFQSRQREFRDLRTTMRDLARPAADRSGRIDHHGFTDRVQVDANGVVRVVGGDGQMTVGFTGDHDLFMIRDARTGAQVTGERYNRIVAQLRARGIGVEHGAHMNWGAPVNQEHIFGAVVSGHIGEAPTPAAPAGAAPRELLVTFGGDGGPTRTNARDLLSGGQQLTDAQVRARALEQARAAAHADGNDHHDTPQSGAATTAAAGAQAGRDHPEEEAP